jgi:hypothetical protein
MISEQSDRIGLGWSHERLARASNVDVASVYLLERMGTAGPEDDARIRRGLSQGKGERIVRHADPAANDLGPPEAPQHAGDTSSG